MTCAVGAMSSSDCTLKMEISEHEAWPQPQGGPSRRQRAESKSENQESDLRINNRRHTPYQDMAVNLCPPQTPGTAPDWPVLPLPSTQHLVSQLMFLLCLKCSIGIPLPSERSPEPWLPLQSLRLLQPHLPSLRGCKILAHLWAFAHAIPSL